jgi:hypothetical protein
MLNAKELPTYTWVIGGEPGPDPAFYYGDPERPTS